MVSLNGDVRFANRGQSRSRTAGRSTVAVPAVSRNCGIGRQALLASPEMNSAKHLDKQDQRSLALWAADCAEHVLPFFEEKHPQDDRPRKAIEAARAWVRGEIACGAARAAAVAAHAAARDADEGAARDAARATGHAAGTAHMAGHARHAAAYAVKAATAAAIPTDTVTASVTERDWQCRRLSVTSSSTSPTQ